MLENYTFEELNITLLPKALGEYSTKFDDKLLLEVAESLNKSTDEDLYTSLILMQMLAKNNPKMYSALGDRYYYGIGFLKDEQKALALFDKADKASENGGVLAKYDLAWYYYDRKEYMRAIEFFKECINKQHELKDYMIPKCYAHLGFSYMCLTDPKYQLAIENLTVAAEKYNDNFSKRKLGYLYSNPNSQFFSPEKAINYFSVAAKNGDVYSAVEVANYYIFANEDMKISKNYAAALNYLLPFENSGNIDVIRYLGIIYMNGDDNNNISYDRKKAAALFEKAIEIDPKDYRNYADLGYVYYCLDEFALSKKNLTIADENGLHYYSDFLGRMYMRGDSGEVDLKRALYFYENAYESNCINNVFTCDEYATLLKNQGYYQKAYDVAEYGEKEYNDICFIFTKAELVLTDRVKNRISREEAAELMELCIKYNTETATAHFLLGNYNYSIQNYRIAENHYSISFNLGYCNAAIGLARLYEYGGGSITPNLDLAYKWYVEAANKGSDLGRAEAACFKKGLLGGYRRVRRL